MKNVRCAGGGTKKVVPVIRHGKKVARHLNGQACGWKGERYNLAPYAVGATYTEVMVRKPCPRCGGAVELIEGAPNA